MSLLVDPSRNRERGRDDKRVRSFQEAKPKDSYYREEYGWIMSDADVAKEEGVRVKYDAAVTETQSNIDTARNDMNSAVAKGRSGINNAYDDGISKIVNPNADMVPVRVVNGATIEATYMLPRDVVASMEKDSFNQGEGSFVGAYVEDGKFFNVDVTPVGISDAYGKELHESIGNTVEQVDNNYKLYTTAVGNANKERNVQLKTYDEENAIAVAGAEERWGLELDHASGGYSTRIADGKKQYDDSKKKYNDSIMGMDEGLLESRISLNRPKRQEQQLNEKKL